MGIRALPRHSDVFVCIGKLNVVEEGTIHSKGNTREVERALERSVRTAKTLKLQIAVLLRHIKRGARGATFRNHGFLIDGRVGVGDLNKVSVRAEFDFGDLAVYLSNVRNARAPQVVSRVERIGDICLSGGIRVRVIRLLFIGDTVVGSRIPLGRIALR